MKWNLQWQVPKVAIHPLIPGRIGIWKCWFLWREENWNNWRKTSGVRTRTNNKLNSHDMGTWNRTWATLVGGERSHHCATPPPHPYIPTLVA